MANQIKCTLETLDEIMYELSERDDYDLEYEVAEQGDDYCIFVETTRVILPQMSLEMRYGYYGLWQEEYETYMPDFDLTAIYEQDAEPTDYLYYEQDGFAVSLHNFLNATHSKYGANDATECIVIICE